MAEMEAYHSFEVRVYYEDTDLSGSVYHANYLKFFERAREHYIGPERLARLYEEEGLGFVVYEMEVSFRRGASLSDRLEIRSAAEVQSDYRAVFEQDAWPIEGSSPLVEATIELVCVDDEGELVELPGVVPKVGEL